MRRNGEVEDIVVAGLLKLFKKKEDLNANKIFHGEGSSLPRVVKFHRVVEREIRLALPRLTKMKGWPNTFEERSVIFQISVNCSTWRCSTNAGEGILQLARASNKLPTRTI